MRGVSAADGSRFNGAAGHLPEPPGVQLRAPSYNTGPGSAESGIMGGAVTRGFIMTGSYTLCRSCDMIVELQARRRHVSCSCPRCHTLLRSGRKADIRTSAIVGIGGLLMLAVTVSSPFITISCYGLTTSVSMASVIGSLQRDWTLLLVIFLAFTLIFPLIMIGMQIASGLCGYRPGIKAAVTYSICHRSCYVDVLILGLVVSLIKLTMMASVEFHAGFYIGIAFAMICIWCWSNVSPYDYWNLVTPRVIDSDAEPGRRGCDQGYVMCRYCHMTYRGGDHSRCVRCMRLNSFRHEGSSYKTALYLAAALILYLPSNIYPIMFTTYLGNESGSNIIDGAIALWKMESYLVAMVILIASIFIPVFKIVALSYILLRLIYASEVDRHRLAMIYRMVEFIGKWSMVDVFVVVIMTASVHLTGLLVIEPGVAILIFFSVVLITMMAAWIFDERLIWDKNYTVERHE